jgi:hypothetical protein
MISTHTYSHSPPSPPRAKQQDKRLAHTPPWCHCLGRACPRSVAPGPVHRKPTGDRVQGFGDGGLGLRVRSCPDSKTGLRVWGVGSRALGRRVEADLELEKAKADSRNKLGSDASYFGHQQPPHCLLSRSNVALLLQAAQGFGVSASGFRFRFGVRGSGFGVRVWGLR